MVKLRLPCVLLSLATLALAGCESSGGRHHRPDSGEPAAPAVAMAGQQIFFDGQLRAEATLGQGRGAHFADDEKGGGGSGHGGHRGGGGGGHHGGGMRGGGGMGGDYASSSDGPAIHLRGSPLPPVKLRFRLANLAKTTLNVRIVDFKSDLGDFAVRPDQVTLDAGQTIEVDPMFSQLDVSGDDIPVTVVLQIGDKKESHDLILKLLPPAPPAPPADAEKK